MIWRLLPGRIKITGATPPRRHAAGSGALHRQHPGLGQFLLRADAVVATEESLGVEGDAGRGYNAPAGLLLNGPHLSPQRLGGPGGRTAWVQGSLSLPHRFSGVAGQRHAGGERPCRRRKCHSATPKRLGSDLDAPRGLPGRDGLESHSVRLPDHTDHHFLFRRPGNHELASRCGSRAAAAGQEGKPVIIDFSAAWCTP